MIYTISKGEFNYLPEQFSLHLGTTSETYEVEYNESCLYEPVDWENDWNKVAGWSYGVMPKILWSLLTIANLKKHGLKWLWNNAIIPSHHKNSIRIGTRPAGGGLEHEIYTYQNGKRVESASTFIIPLNERAVLKLTHVKGLATLQWFRPITLEPVRQIALDCNIKPSYGYRLYPTFGGSFASPKDMSFNMKRL